MPAYELWLSGCCNKCHPTLSEPFQMSFLPSGSGTVCLFVLIWCWDEQASPVNWIYSRMENLGFGVSLASVTDMGTQSGRWTNFCPAPPNFTVSHFCHCYLQRVLLKCKHCHYCCLGCSSLHLLSLLGQTCSCHLNPNCCSPIVDIVNIVIKATHQLLTSMPKSTAVMAAKAHKSARLFPLSCSDLIVQHFNSLTC